jgi:hypothetical protein
MQVNLTVTPGTHVRSAETSASAPAKPERSDEAVFSRHDALDRALQDDPDVRTEEVERTRDLFTSVQYPPVQLIHRISRLLARDWTTRVS